MELTLKQLVEQTELGSAEQVKQFHLLRHEATLVAMKVFQDRALSYNSDHECVQEMVFGPISLASELYKRTRRMCGLLTPLRDVPLNAKDVNRVIDLTVDIINYSSWLYAQMRMVNKDGGDPDGDLQDFSKTPPMSELLADITGSPAEPGGMQSA